MAAPEYNSSKATQLILTSILLTSTKRKFVWSAEVISRGCFVSFVIGVPEFERGEEGV